MDALRGASSQKRPVQGRMHLLSQLGRRDFPWKKILPRSLLMALLKRDLVERVYIPKGSPNPNS